MIGSTISHYRILEKLGEGGMGVVYKAQDTKLDRVVALKFLPTHLNASEQDKARFMQEARAAAALNHPNVCSVIDIQDHDGQMFIVMECVEGQTLKEKLSGMSLKQAVDIGAQIADGLAAAHEKGIVHRDIKPENVMIRKDGIAQIMDFGLAKLRGVSRLTQEGSTVGTAGYMSPEQVQGQDVDHRSDIFSMGVVLYEMFTGRMPFRGAHETAMQYEIVNVDAPPMSSVKPEISPDLDAIVLECLAKDPDERTQSAKQVGVDLKRYRRESGRQRASRVTRASPVVHVPGTSVPEFEQALALRTGPIGRFKRDPLAWSLTCLFFLGLLGMTFSYGIRPHPAFQTIRSVILPPDSTTFRFYGVEAGPVVLSPDGQRLAFVATQANGKAFLYVRPLEALSAEVVAGTEGASYPFWSPDNQFIGFFADGKLKKINWSGGPPVTLCDANLGRGGSWSVDGIIAFTPTAGSPIFTVPAAGGVPVAVTRLDHSRKEQTHRWPYFLPDGKHFFYQVRTAVTGIESENDAIFVASLDGKVNKSLVKASSNVAYASGYMLFVNAGTLIAQQFDEGALELRGEPIAVARGVLNDAGFNLAVFSASKNGVLAYQTGVAQAGSKLAIFDRSGKRSGEVSDVTEFYTPRISPDGLKVAVGTYDAKSRNQDIWIYDIVRGIRTRFTFDLAVEFQAQWSPDGSQTVFSSDRNGMFGLYEKASSGAGTEQLLYESHYAVEPTDWSRDGRFIAFEAHGDSTKRGDIWILDVSGGSDGNRKATPFLQTEFYEGDAHFSPDGKWLAYMSDESGQVEIYLRPFPGLGGKWQVSTNGGAFPRWRRDGKELYYMNIQNTLMAAEILTGESTVSVRGVKRLFNTRPILLGTAFDAFPDGQRFLVNSHLEMGATDPITLVVNWDRELIKK